MINPEQTKLDEIVMVGVTAKTDDQREISGEGHIGRLWHRFFQENLSAKITNKNSENLYGLYYDYKQSGERLEYSVLVGCIVNSKDEIPQGMEAITLPASNYARFSTAGGEMIEETRELWGKIWSEWIPANPDERSFTGDFEEYDAAQLSSTKGKVKVYLATK